MNFSLQSGIEKSIDELIFCVDREWHLGHENSQSKATDFNLTRSAWIDLVGAWARFPNWYGGQLGSNPC